MQKICETKCCVMLCVNFMKLNNFDNLIGKMLHPSKESLPKIECNKIKL